MATLAQYLTMVKFSHTVFALPFAVVGLVLGIRAAGTFDIMVVPLVLVCMVTARNAAMGFNRWADRQFDARNARTATREIPAGSISPTAALWFVGINCLLFVAATYPLNASLLCFYLSPVALAVVLGYSYTKRFTALCHLVLGLGLGLAVVTWVSGFDIIYALQDDQFDRTHGLHSIPAWLGRQRALWLSTALHVGTAACLALFGYWLQLGPLYWGGYALFCGLLIYQHLLVKPHDLSRVNLAFFTTNGIGSVAFGTLTALSVGMGW